MTTFTLHGTFAGREIDLTWADGDLSGDAAAVREVRAIAEGYEGHMTGQPGGPYTTHDHLSSPYTARSLMRMVFTGRPTMTGSVPALPDPPKGAVR